MSEAQGDMGASAELDLLGPDYFSFYTHEVAELLSHDEDFLPLISGTGEFGGRTYDIVGDKAVTRHKNYGKKDIVLGSLFCSPIGARLSDFKKERLKALLRQSVVALSQEVDEMLDPVFAICRLQSHLRSAKHLPSYSAAASEGDAEQHPHKKIKLSSSASFPSHGSPVGAEVDEDLQFLLENSAKVEESMKKHSDELSKSLGHMEKKLEEILDIILSSCRLMTLSEKQQLQKFIQKLPPRNLDRVVEIIQRNKPSGEYSSGKIHVDLEKEDNLTLWRLYCYVEAVENARKLSR